jgi:hypothetical protein
MHTAQSHRRGIILYLEYQSVCPFVRIGSPWPQPPHPQASVSPLGTGGATLDSGWKGANSGDRRKSLALCLLCGTHSLCLPLFVWSLVTAT